MHWTDMASSPGGPWEGLDITVTAADLPARSPCWCVEVASRRRLRISSADAPVAWAHIHNAYAGLWLLLADPAASWHVVPPIRAAEVAAVHADIHAEPWWREWARWFARALTASPNTALHPGRWMLSPARSTDTEAAPFPVSPPDYSGMGWVDGVQTCLDAPSLHWENWMLSGSDALFRTRKASPPDAARVHALRKQAGARTLPPVLVQYISGLDMFALLDGHDRLRAALLEHAPVPLLVLQHVRAVPQRPDPARQAAVLRGIEKEQQLRRHAGEHHTDAQNRALITAFDDREWLRTISRAYPLRGGAARWDEEVARASGQPASHPLFSGEAPER